VGSPKYDFTVVAESQARAGDRERQRQLTTISRRSVDVRKYPVLQ
jgi:hypothetical protein